MRNQSDEKKDGENPLLHKLMLQLIRNFLKNKYSVTFNMELRM